MKRELSIVLCLLLLPGMTGVKASADSPEKKTASAMNNKQNVRQKITPVGTRKPTSVRPLSVCEVKVNLPTDSMLLSWVGFLSPSVTEAPKVEEVRQTVRGSIVLDYSRGQKTKYDERNFVEAVYKLLAVTRPLKGTPGMSLEGIRLTGYTAPDGDYRVNERLGLQRALALKDYIRREKSFGTIPFEVNWIAEDWKGLTDLIVGSEMAFKESVLDIIRTVDVVDGRERMLMDLAGGTAYHYLSSAFFGRLRRIDYEVNYVDRSLAAQSSTDIPEKGAAAASGQPELLSVADFCRLAEAHAVGSAEFNDLMDLAGRLYPDSPVACINAAGVALLRRDTERARRYLQRFATLPEAGCNMGILCLLEGDRGKAEVYLSLAQAGGSVPAGRVLRFVQSK